MDISGARALSERIAQQRHWRQARAVQIGSQPSSDPDGHALESFRGDVRTYRPQERIEIVDGRPTMVTRRVFKRLIDGIWEGEVVVLGIQDVA
jgi:hypothetical protein